MIRLIAAIDRKRGIAKQGFQPWFIPADGEYFGQQTKLYGAVILVGSTTFKTFSGPLTGRQNYVLTRDKTPIDGVELVHDLASFLKDYVTKDLWVIGGANVFAQIMELERADELYLTQIEADFGCNQFFPHFGDTYTLVEESDLHEQNGFIFTYNRYVKQSSIVASPQPTAQSA